MVYTHQQFSLAHHSRAVVARHDWTLSGHVITDYRLPGYRLHVYSRSVANFLLAWHASSAPTRYQILLLKSVTFQMFTPTPASPLSPAPEPSPFFHAGLCVARFVPLFFECFPFSSGSCATPPPDPRFDSSWHSCPSRCSKRPTSSPPLRLGTETVPKRIQNSTAAASNKSGFVCFVSLVSEGISAVIGPIATCLCGPACFPCAATRCLRTIWIDWIATSTPPAQSHSCSTTASMKNEEHGKQHRNRQCSKKWTMNATKKTTRKQLENNKKTTRKQQENNKKTTRKQQQNNNKTTTNSSWC